MSSLSTLPKGDSAWLLRKAIERIIQQVSVLETNIGSSTTGNSSNTQVIFNDNGTLRGDPDLIFNTSQNKLVATALESTTSLFVGTSATITGDLTVRTNKLAVTSTGVGVGTLSPNNTLTVRGSQDAGIEVNSADSNSSRIITAYDPANTRFYINSTSSGSGTVLPLDFLIGNSAQYRIAASGVFTWFDGLGGTRMTLNANGLGVGVVPSAGKFEVQESGTGGGIGGIIASTATVGGNAGYVFRTGGTNRWSLSLTGSAGAESIRFYDVNNSATRLLIDSSGNVGIGVTPITSHILSSAGPIGISGTNSGTRTSYISNSGACSIYYTDGGGAGYFTDFGNLIIQPRTSSARSVVIATGSTTPVERAVVKSTGQVRFVPLASDPAGAEAGDVYYNSTSNKLKCYNGTTWNDLF